jgi:solute carrier family 25 (mitochondrial citrate transporter), member 1
LAAVRQAVVRWLHHAHNRQLAQGGHTCVPAGGRHPALEAYGEADSGLVRAGFVAFDQYKSMLADADGKISGPGTVIAGFGAGVTESLLAVTPFESIKTTL